jgi:hypothetical protein
MNIPGEEATGPLYYSEPDGHCKSVLEAIKAQNCSMDVTHSVSGATVQRHAIEKRGFSIGSDMVSEDFCRHYELLHSKPCK